MNEERMHQILLRPIVSEKSTTMAEKRQQVVFEVLPNANKAEVRNAVEKLFDVKVTGVNTIRVKGKTKLFRGRRGRRSDYKKAIVTLAEGHNVDYLAGL